MAEKVGDPGGGAGASIEAWTVERLACALIVDLCRWYDAGGLSHGRSLESTLAELTRDLLRRHRPEGDIASWPSRERLIEEARDRIRTDLLSFETLPAGGSPVPARPVEGCTSFYHLWQGPPVGEPGEPDAYQSCLCGKLIWKHRGNATVSGYKTIHAARPGEEPPDAPDLQGSAGGARAAAPLSAAQSTGTPSTDAIWTLLNEADDQKSRWPVQGWGAWFVQLVDAVSALDNVLARHAEAIEDRGVGAARPDAAPAR